MSIIINCITNNFLCTYIFYHLFNSLRNLYFWQGSIWQVQLPELLLVRRKKKRRSIFLLRFSFFEEMELFLLFKNLNVNITNICDLFLEIHEVLYVEIFHKKFYRIHLIILTFVKATSYKEKTTKKN